MRIFGRHRLAILTTPGLVAIVLLLVAPVQSFLPANPPGSGSSFTTSASSSSFRAKIDHIIIVMMENHAYDNYFGTYCTHQTKLCSMAANGLPANTCVPYDPSNLSLGCIKPFTFNTTNWTITSPMPHSANSSMKAYDNGSMDGFYAAEKSGIDPFGHYTSHSAGLLWDFAEQYGLGDAFYSSDPSYSLPNHWHLVAGQTPNEVQWKLVQAQQPFRQANRSLYLDEANQTPSIQDLLLNSSVSWNWYDHRLPQTYNNSIKNLTYNVKHDQPAGQAFGYWNPQGAKAESYNSSFYNHYVNNTQFFVDARNGNLPNVSWVIPNGRFSDHPPASSANAQAFLSSVINSVELSPEWNSTALFISWDEYGGFYDHVAPPNATGTTQMLGFRVPLLVISPYAKENYIGKSLGYFESLLHLVEVRFNLGCLTPMDCNAPLPFNFFDFGQSPRPPIVFANGVGTANYPMPLQNATNYNTWPKAPYFPPSQFATMPATDMTFTTE